MEGVVDMVHDRVTYRSKTLFCRNRIDPTRIVKWMPNAYALCIAHLEVSCVVSFFTRNFKKKQSWMPPFKKQVCVPYGNLWCGSACAPCGTLLTRSPGHQKVGRRQGRRSCLPNYSNQTHDLWSLTHQRPQANRAATADLQYYFLVL
jgi:hypothetical protein